MRWSKLILTFLLLSLFTACMHKSEEDRFIDDLLQRMTIEEKIGQLNQLDPSWDMAAKEQLIREGRVVAHGCVYYKMLAITKRADTFWKHAHIYAQSLIVIIIRRGIRLR